MRVLVCGGRDFNDARLLQSTLNLQHHGVGTESQKHIDVIIEGGGHGADYLAHLWSRSHLIPCETYRADWDTYGNEAGPIRNERMLKEGKPDLVIAFPTKNSRGTWHMVRIAREAGVEVIVIES